MIASVLTERIEGPSRQCKALGCHRGVTPENRQRLGEACSHVDCPQRVTVTAAPPVEFQNGPTPKRGGDQQWPT